MSNEKENNRNSMGSSTEYLNNSVVSRSGEQENDATEGEKTSGPMSYVFEAENMSTDLERKLFKTVTEQKQIINRMNSELSKLRKFIGKRKQSYKRKRKAGDVPTRALSAYNIFVRERFSKLASENEHALYSSDVGVELKRVPPATLVAKTGVQWKDLPEEEKGQYRIIAEVDKKRYETQMSEYTSNKPKKQKRSKTGYNMFFSEFVKEFKATNKEGDTPPERGLMARLVGHAWKKLGPEDRNRCDLQAEKFNENRLRMAANLISAGSAPSTNNDAAPTYPPSHSAATASTNNDAVLTNPLSLPPATASTNNDAVPTNPPSYSAAPASTNNGTAPTNPPPYSVATAPPQRVDVVASLRNNTHPAPTAPQNNSSEAVTTRTPSQVVPLTEAEVRWHRETEEKERAREMELKARERARAYALIPGRKVPRRKKGETKKEAESRKNGESRKAPGRKSSARKTPARKVPPAKKKKT